MKIMLLIFTINRQKKLDKPFIYENILSFESQWKKLMIIEIQISTKSKIDSSIKNFDNKFL